MNKKIYALISCCLAFAGLESNISATEPFPSIIEKDVSTDNSAHDQDLIVDHTKEMRYSRYDFISSTSKN